MEVYRKTRNSSKEIVSCAAALLLLFINLTPANQFLRDSFSFVFTPITFFSSNLAESIENRFDSIKEISSLKNENNQLNMEVARLNSEADLLALLLEENAALRREIGLGDPESNLIEAKVLGVGVGGVDDYVLINKGARDGLNKGDIVRIGNIFVGIVSDLEERSSKVTLPNSNSSFLEVIIVDSSAEGMSISELKQKYNNDSSVSKLFSGVAVGSTSGISIENIATDSDIKEGDAVVVNDSRVNDFLYLGEISEIVDDPSASQKNAFVSLPLNYQEINFVFVQIENE